MNAEWSPAPTSLPATIQDARTLDGFPLRSVPSQTDWIGHTNVIGIHDNGTFEAGSDPLADGLGIVVEIPKAGRE